MKTITAQVGYYPPLTPELLQSIGARLACPLVKQCVRAARRGKTKSFAVDLGEIHVVWPGGRGPENTLEVNL